MRLTEEEYRALLGGREPKKSKYNSKRVEIDGFKFDSKKEAKRYSELKILKEIKGDVSYFLLQVPFKMPGTKYVADFLVFWADGSHTVEDTKGFRTATYKLKKRMMAHHYPEVEIVEL